MTRKKEISGTQDGDSQSREKKQAVKKVSTGAWWKSASVEEKSSSKPVTSVADSAEDLPQAPEKGSAAAGDDRKTEVGNVSEDSVSTAPPRKRRSSSRKKKTETSAVSTADAEQQVKDETSSSAAVTPGQQDVAPQGDGEKTPPKRTRRSRKKAVQKTETVQEAPAGMPDEKSVEVGTAEAAPVEEVEQEKKTPSRSRSSRQRRKKKKVQTDAIADSDADAQKEEPLSGGWEVFVAAEHNSPVKSAEKAPAENEDVSDSIEENDDELSNEAIDDRKLQEEGAESLHKPVIKLLINADEPEECRLALLEDGRLESIHVATSTRTQTKNNIYKGRIVAIEPNLQAAFVEYGTEKNGFLPFAEIHPEYYKDDVPEQIRGYIEQRQWKKLSITDVMERGCEVLVQVVKEEVGKKGANMTTYLSLPGHCVVLMPGSDSTGVSRKISGEEKRAQLREYLMAMDIPEEIGWIVRTASNDITQEALQRDVDYLLKLWGEVRKRAQNLDGVGLVYQDHDHVLRFLREHFDPDIQEILVDSPEALKQVKEFVEVLPQKHQTVRCKLHRGSRPIFNLYSIEDQIESIYQPKVNLPSGGSIVIDPTEALVAIDVNSGSTQKGANFEETIFQANMEAATELARQLRLRDLGGLVVVDFIDMRSRKNIREVEQQVRKAMKRDKAKVDFSRISKFGLLQISRQKLGAPIEAGNYRVCEHCKGRGVVRSVETLALFYLRRIHTGASKKNIERIECRFPMDVAQYLLNNKRQEIRDLEIRYGSSVVIMADPALTPSENDIVFLRAEKEEKNKNRS